LYSHEQVAGVKKVCTIEKTESSQISVGTNALRIGNTIDTTINIFTTSLPLLYGDNRNITLGPHNASYDGIWNVLKKSKIEINKAHVTNYSKPILVNTKPNSFVLQMPHDFRKCTLPNVGNESTLLLAPEEFIEQLNNEKKIMMSLQKKIKDAQLNDEQLNQLHQAIQGNFKEWLIKCPQFKSMIEFIKLIDQSKTE
jgi:Tubulin binding cofactor C